jgi:hypothetical protein
LFGYYQVVPAVVSLSSFLDSTSLYQRSVCPLLFRIALSCTGFLTGQYRGVIAVSISTVSLGPSGKRYGITLAMTRAILLCGSMNVAVIISDIAQNDWMRGERRIENDLEVFMVYFSYYAGI